ncbi:MAG: hypothetical protein H7A41_04050 [Chlamydiales bacterium]|nr:hypothetical protein [Chlamydiia bacterium]MCP5504307.1 hypothetical protein [Chlamydiales bacterium]
MKSGWYQIFLKNWWVIAFVLMACGFYLQAIHKKNRLVKTLQERIDLLSQTKREAEEKKEELLLRFQSQEDPEWLELVLKENLGVTAEGELKVVFE